MTSFKDWFGFPKENGLLLRRLDPWFHETVNSLRAIDTRLTTAESDIDTNTTNISTNTTNISTNTTNISTNSSNITSLEASASPTLASGWANYGTGDAYCEVRKTRDGLVILQGRISNTSGSAKASNSTVTTLASTYRPTRQHLYTQQCSEGGADQYLLVVRTTGVVSMTNVAGSGGSLSASGWISIDCCWHVDG